MCMLVSASQLPPTLYPDGRGASVSTASSFSEVQGLFRARCRVCGQRASATAAGVVCAHESVSEARCSGTGHRALGILEPAPSIVSTGSTCPEVTPRTRAVESAGIEHAGQAMVARLEELRERGRAQLRAERQSRYKPPFEAWQLSGSSLRTVGGGLPGLGRRS